MIIKQQARVVFVMPNRTEMYFCNITGKPVFEDFPVTSSRVNYEKFLAKM